MNCANHPETTAVAYCQYCGKPLCSECVHKVNNVVSCEPCLAARVNAASGVSAGNPGPGATWSGQVSPGNVQPPANWGVNPGIACAVGWIPGVGAVYNGQIAKALVHVAVFAILIDLTHYNGLIGILIPIWIIYMWFDAFHTAKARLYGQPLPNPLGLNDIGSWFVAQRQGQHPGGWNPPNPPSGNSGNPGAPPPTGAAAFASDVEHQVRQAAEQVRQGAEQVRQAAEGWRTGYSSYTQPPPPPPVPPVPPDQYDTGDIWSGRGRGIPTGAIVLILIGIGFLLANVGLLSEYWIDRGWPILLIALGVWLVVRRTHTPPAGGPR